jgi:hypothetical protein
MTAARRFEIQSIDPIPEWWVERFHVNQARIRAVINLILCQKPGGQTAQDLRCTLRAHCPYFTFVEVDYALASMVIDDAIATDDGTLYRSLAEVNS